MIRDLVEALKLSYEAATKKTVDRIA